MRVPIPKTMAEIARQTREVRRKLRSTTDWYGKMEFPFLDEEKIAVELLRQEELSQEERAKFFESVRMADVAVVVVDESLLEDGRFEASISYVMEELKPKDKDMIWVYDKFGEKRQYFRSRFKVVFE